jgi:hypothetical protein
MSNRVIIVWCDSPSGLISTRVDSNDQILQFTDEQLPEIEILTQPEKVFDILKRQDGTKIAIPLQYVSDILGWDLEYTNGHTPEPAASSGIGA